MAITKEIMMDNGLSITCHSENWTTVFLGEAA